MPKLEKQIFMMTKRALSPVHLSFRVQSVHWNISFSVF